MRGFSVDESLFSADAVGVKKESCDSKGEIGNREAPVLPVIEANCFPLESKIRFFDSIELTN